MPKESEKFRLKRGFCHITEDAVMITRYEHLQDFTQRSRLSLMLYAISPELFVSAFILYLAYNAFLIENWINVGFMGLLFLLNAYRIVMHFIYSPDNLIKRSEITLVDYKPGIPFITIPQFVIYYETEGKQRKRLLPVAGMLYGKSARTNAMKIMKASGLYNPGDLNEDLLDSA